MSKKMWFASFVMFSLAAVVLNAQDQILPTQGQAKSTFVIQPKITVEKVEVFDDKVALHDFRLQLNFLDAQTKALVKQEEKLYVVYPFYNYSIDKQKEFGNSVCRLFGYGPMIDMWGLQESFTSGTDYVFSPAGVLSLETAASYYAKYQTKIDAYLIDLYCQKN